MNFKQKIYTTLDSSSANLHAIDKGKAVKSETAENVAADLQYLDQKLTAISKDIQMLDILTITGSVSSYEEYLIKASFLVNGEGLSITNNFEEFNTGDIVYKINNQLVHLTFTASGFYYPSQLKQDGLGYTFTYSYQENVDTPEGDETITKGTDGIWKATQVNRNTYTYTGLQAVDAQYILTYNEYITVTPETEKVNFDIKKYGTDKEEIIMPLIKMFHMVNSYQEQVECEFNLTKTDTQWIISGFPSFVSLITVR